jgi:putative ATPase
MVGMPEASLMLSETCLYLALAPKSNSALTAYTAAKQDILERPNEPVPLQLRNASTDLAKTLGYGAGYRYAHTDKEAQLMDCLPDSLKGRHYYNAGQQDQQPVSDRTHRSRKDSKT